MPRPRPERARSRADRGLRNPSPLQIGSVVAPALGPDAQLYEAGEAPQPRAGRAGSVHQSRHQVSRLGRPGRWGGTARSTPRSSAGCRPIARSSILAWPRSGPDPASGRPTIRVRASRSASSRPAASSPFFPGGRRPPVRPELTGRRACRRRGLRRPPPCPGRISVACAGPRWRRVRTGAGPGCEHPTDVADQPRALGLGPDHEARGVAQEQEREAVAVAVLEEAGRLVRPVGVDGAAQVAGVVGHDAQGVAVDLGQRRHHPRPEPGPQLEHAVLVGQAGDDVPDLIELRPALGDDVPQGGGVGGRTGWRRPRQVGQVPAGRACRRFVTTRSTTPLATCRERPDAPRTGQPAADRGRRPSGPLGGDDRRGRAGGAPAKQRR